MDKIKINKELINRLVFILFISVLLFLGLTNFLFNFTTKFLNEVFNYSLINLTLVSAIKISVGVFDFLKGVGDIVDKIFNFFIVINFLVLFQLTILKISNLLVVKIMLVFVTICSFYKPLSFYFIRILIVLLFLNPGLSLYIGGIKILSETINLELGKNVNKSFSELNKTLKSGDFLKDVGSKESDEDKKKSFFNTASDFFKDPLNKVTSAINDKLTEIGTYFSNILQTIIELAISYLVNTLIIFFVLPVVYFLILYLIVKKIFGDFTNQIKSKPKLLAESK